MPRSRPGALRAEQPGTRVRVGEFPTPIHGLSARTCLAIHRVEVLADDYYLFPGVTKHALRRYREFLTPMGRRPRYPRGVACSCRGCELDDVRHARDVLDQILGLLPVRARAELGRRVAILDAAYLKCTLPDPFADRQWRSDLWWRRRLSAGEHGE